MSPSMTVTTQTTHAVIKETTIVVIEETAILVIMTTRKIQAVVFCAVIIMILVVAKGTHSTTIQIMVV